MILRMFLAAAAALAPAVVLAATAPATPVPGIVVPTGPAPKVVATYPADGSEVPAGTLVLKVVFDRAMSPENWSYSRLPGAGFPNCLERPRLLADKRTFVLLCSASAHQSFAIQINAPKDFAAEAGRSAQPALIRFTTGDVGPRDIHDALQLAGLTDQDDPVMTWRDSGAGVSRPAADANP